MNINNTFNIVGESLRKSKLITMGGKKYYESILTFENKKIKFISKFENFVKGEIVEVKGKYIFGLYFSEK